VIAPFSDAVVRLQTIPASAFAQLSRRRRMYRHEPFPDGRTSRELGRALSAMTSRGKRRSGRARKGTPLCAVRSARRAWVGSHPDTTSSPVPSLQSPLRSQVRGKALFAVVHTLSVIIWNFLATDQATYGDLGPDLVPAA